MALRRPKPASEVPAEPSPPAPAVSPALAELRAFLGRKDLIMRAAATGVEEALLRETRVALGSVADVLNRTGLDARVGGSTLKLKEIEVEVLATREGILVRATTGRGGFIKEELLDFSNIEPTALQASIARCLQPAIAAMWLAGAKMKGETHATDFSEALAREEARKARDEERQERLAREKAAADQAWAEKVARANGR